MDYNPYYIEALIGACAGICFCLGCIFWWLVFSSFANTRGNGRD